MGTMRPTPSKTFKGSDEVCCVCEQRYSSRWFRGVNHDVIVCRVCAQSPGQVYQGHYGDMVTEISVKDSRPRPEMR